MFVQSCTGAKCYPERIRDSTGLLQDEAQFVHGSLKIVPVVCGVWLCLRPLNCGDGVRCQGRVSGTKVLYYIS